MTAKCTKCVEHFREQKRRLELVHDLKAKNEGMSHAFLKTQACSMIRKLGQENFPDDPTKVETEVPVEGVGKVDVLGRIGEATVVVECGNTNPKKIWALEKQFDIVLHIPFCYTWNLININVDEIIHQLVVALVVKELEKRQLTKALERNKAICLEEGECSLPSGRCGFPEEAMQIAGLTIDHIRKKKILTES